MLPDSPTDGGPLSGLAAPKFSMLTLAAMVRPGLIRRLSSIGSGAAAAAAASPEKVTQGERAARMDSWGARRLPALMR